MKKEHATVQCIMKLPDRGRSIEGNILSDLLRSIWDSRKITPREIERYITRWVNKHYADNEKHRSSAKSNLNRSLANPELSYKTFFRGISMLPIKEITLTAQVRWIDDIITYHQASAVQSDTFKDLEEIGGLQFTPKHRDEIQEDFDEDDFEE